MVIIASEGDNRTFKTGTLAIIGWLAYTTHQDVYSICPVNPKGGFDHVFNFPHKDILFDELTDADLHDCTLLSDEFDSLADSYIMPTNKLITLTTNFNYQVKKSDVTWAWTAVEHGNVQRRIRRNPDFIIENHRIPPNYNEPLQAVKWKIWNRTSGDRPPKIIYLTKPQLFFPLWNSKQKTKHFYNRPQPINESLINKQLTEIPLTM